jgi:DNA replication protein DnaC
VQSVSEQIAALVARCQARAEDPEFQRQARRLEEETREAEEVRRSRELHFARLRSGVPVGLWNPVHPEASPLEDPKPTPALDAVRAHLAADSACVFLTLSGKRGLGKTFAAAWGVYARGGRFVDAHDLVRLSAFDEGEWRDLERQPFLAIDELGAEYLNDAYRANLYGLLNRRFADQRKTVLATNLAAPAFVARYCPDPEDRLLDRLTNAGTWLNLDGASMRAHWADGEREP